MSLRAPVTSQLAGPARAWLGLLALLVVLPFRCAAAAAAVGAGQWSWPLAGSPSVERGFEPPSEPWLAGHRGVDLLAWPGEPVRSAGAGRVTFAGLVAGVPAMTVTHADGRRTTYQPVLPAVGRGDVVARGAVLGRISAGGSHCLPLACLHWGLLDARGYLDPLSLVGADLPVRLLPLWSGAGPPALAPPPVPPNPDGGGFEGRPLAARVGAVNRFLAWVRASRADRPRAGRSPPASCRRAPTA